MLSRLSVMKTHTGNTFQHLRARARVDATYVLETVFFRARGYVSRRFDRPTFPSPRLASPRLPTLLPSTVERCPMPSTRYEACLITRSVHGPIELPSCRRSPSPLSRSPLESVVSPFSVRASPPHVRPRLRCLTLSTGSVLLSDEDHRFSFIARTVPPRSLRSIIRSVRVRIHYPFAPKNV